MKKSIIILGGISLLVGCQSTNILNGEFSMKKYENGSSFMERREINKWVSSEYTDSYIKSYNFNNRKPTSLIIHHTDSNDDNATIKIFKNGGVSSHYLISRTGEIIQFVDENNRAFHAGDSYWNGFEDINSSSIGIELSNDMETPYTEEQINSLILLSKDIVKRYGIRKDMVLGHLDIAPGRKVDPYINFPWDVLAKNDLGVLLNEDEISQVVLPENFDWKNALMEIGYSLKDINKTLQSFRIKYMKSLNIGEPTEEEKKYMLSLSKKLQEIRNPTQK